LEKGAHCLSSIQSLDGRFGILVEMGERDNENTLYLVSLVELDLWDKEIRKLHTIEYRCYHVAVIMNKPELMEFFLQLCFNEGYSVQICKVIKNEIVVEDTIELDYLCKRYSDGCLYGLDWNYDDGYLLKRKISNVSFFRLRMVILTTT
jgi:hypothetical protein